MSEFMFRNMASSHSRRDFLRLAAAGGAGLSFSGWFDSLAAYAGDHPQRRRACILLWMNGGPSQMDTFDLKPGNVNGGPFRETPTATEGIRISEHLPLVARQMNRMAIIRSMSTPEGDHERGSHLMHTGYRQQGPIQYPGIGSLVAKELGSDDSALPNFVSIGAARSLFGVTTAGFLGPRYAPLVLAEGAFQGADEPTNYDNLLRVPNLRPAGDVTREQADARLDLLRSMEGDFAGARSGVAVQSRQTAYERATRLMNTAAARAFNLDEETAATRDRYGRNLFGQGCLLARRLVERGVPFVEVSLGRAPGASLGWDTHGQNFDAVRSLSGVLDPAWAMLMDDLHRRGLLDSTLIIWMGEFGRTPRINSASGRDHYPNAWSTVLAGGGIRGGQVVGRTSRDGTTIEERRVTILDLLSTACRALGIDPTRQNNSNVGRPIRIVDQGANPIREILA